MGIATGFTKEHMQAIEDEVIVGADIVGDELILTRHDGGTVNLGSVRGAAGVDGIDGVDGGTGPTGPPGTAGVWINGSDFEDGSFPEINPINSGYQVIGNLVIPAATITRSVILFGQIALKALTTQNATYRGSIRDTADSSSWVTNLCAFNTNTAGLPGTISMVSRPFYMGVGVTKTFEMRVRRESGSGGSTDGDGALNTFTAFVSPSALPAWWTP